MTIGKTVRTTRSQPLRLWPGVVAVAVQWLAWVGLPSSSYELGMASALGVLLGGLGVLVWWAFFSRAPRLERWGAIVLMVLGVAVTSRLIDASIATAGMGVSFFIYAIPVLCLVLVVWAAASRGLAAGPRRATMVVAILLACAAWTLLRNEGLTGEGNLQLAWRWTDTPEERLLARGGDAPGAPPAASPLLEAEAGWPGFRGPGRDGVVAGVRIATDWTSTPPLELWRRPIGPGASSFAVGGGRLYTQEQRGAAELVSCYDAATGEPVWWHRDAVRFWDSHVGAGPRATPALSGTRLVTVGATGLLNVLDAADGGVVWSRDAAADAGAEIPDWGFAGSPLVVEDLVIVALAGRLLAYDLASGDPRWSGPDGGTGYSSPHLLTLAGVPQVLLSGGAGVTSLAPADGALLWQDTSRSGFIVQPALTADGDLLIGTSGAIGPGELRRIAVAPASGGWRVDERWASAGLRPYFNDFVVHEGHAYGFDGRILAAIDLVDGERRWKGGRYGSGQLLLLPEQDLLLVVSERGELALVAAAPDGFTELARVPALAGRTWNHPVLVGDLLVVRNGQEMAAFRLPLAAG